MSPVATAVASSPLAPKNKGYVVSWGMPCRDAVVPAGSLAKMRVAISVVMPTGCGRPCSTAALSLA